MLSHESCHQINYCVDPWCHWHDDRQDVVMRDVVSLHHLRERNQCFHGYDSEAIRTSLTDDAVFQLCNGRIESADHVEPECLCGVRNLMCRDKLVNVVKERRRTNGVHARIAPDRATPSVYLDSMACAQRAAERIAEVAEQGAWLAVFPETFIPGDPLYHDYTMLDSEPFKFLERRFVEQGHRVAEQPSGVIDQVLERPAVLGTGLPKALLDIVTDLAGLGNVLL